jgi:hypothetical protein
MACHANHPGICVGYRLFTDRGSISFFPDNESHQGQRRTGQGPDVPAPAALDHARSQDRELVDFLRGSEVLIMDAQYDRQEYQRHVGWGHGCVDDVVALALEARVKRLFLFHHDPDHDDARISEMAAMARQLVAARHGTLEVEAAREGLTVELG